MFVYVRSDDITVVNLKITVFCDVMPRNLVEYYQKFEGTCHLQFYDRRITGTGKLGCRYRELQNGKTVLRGSQCDTALSRRAGPNA